MGLLYQDDLSRTQLNFFKEAAKLKGTQVTFLPTDTEVKDIYTDVTVESLTDEEDVKVIDILFETFPANRKTLERNGWYNKDAEFHPIIAYVPLDLEELSRWGRVLLPATIAEPFNGTYSMYEVSKISTRMEHPFYWTVALVPVFPDNSPSIDRTKNSNFIDFSQLDEDGNPIVPDPVGD